ncbi:MAG: hypothetical protein ACREH8_02920 [Opitutaceae bacterium]
MLGSAKETVDTAAVDLTDEDTEDDAEERVLAGISDWTGGPCNVHTAIRTLRLAGQTEFAFRRAQFRVTISGSGEDPLISGHTYEVTVAITRRIAGSAGPFLPYSIAVFNLTASGPSKTSDWIDIENEAGWETKADSCSFLDLSP